MEPGWECQGPLGPFPQESAEVVSLGPLPRSSKRGLAGWPVGWGGGRDPEPLIPSGDLRPRPRADQLTHGVD